MLTASGAEMTADVAVEIVMKHSNTLVANEEGCQIGPSGSMSEALKSSWADPETVEKEKHNTCGISAHN